MHSFISATFFITFVSLVSAIPAYMNIFTLAGTNFNLLTKLYTWEKGNLVPILQHWNNIYRSLKKRLKQCIFLL